MTSSFLPVLPDQRHTSTPSPTVQPLPPIEHPLDSQASPLLRETSTRSLLHRRLAESNSCLFAHSVSFVVLSPCPNHRLYSRTALWNNPRSLATTPILCLYGSIPADQVWTPIVGMRYRRRSRHDAGFCYDLADMAFILRHNMPRNGQGLRVLQEQIDRYFNRTRWEPSLTEPQS